MASLIRVGLLVVLGLWGLAGLAIETGNYLVADLVAYAGCRDDRTCDSLDIILADLRAGLRRNLTDSDLDEHHPYWSPDGRYLLYSAYSPEESAQAFLVDFETLQTEPVLPDAALVNGATWSPAGGQIVVSGMVEQEDGASNLDILVLDVETNSVDNLTQTPGVFERLPVWSPDGRRIAFHTNPMDRRGVQLYLIEHGGGAASTASALRSTGGFVDFSPGGEQIVYAVSTLVGAVLQIAPADGTAPPETLAETELSTIGAVAWSPDGETLLYHGLEGYSGVPQLFAYSLASGEVKRVTEEVDGLSTIAWSPDGDAVLIATRRFRTRPYGNICIAYLDGRDLACPPALTNGLQAAWRPR